MGRCDTTSDSVLLGTTWVQNIVNLIRNNGDDDPKPLVQAAPWIASSYPVEIPKMLMKCHLLDSSKATAPIV